MAGRPKNYTDEELIDKATEVFWEKGYNAASAKDLLKAMDIGQGSFYRSFPGGKKELYQKSLNRFFDKANKRFSKGLSETNDPKQFIKDFFLSVVDRPIAARKNGCYLGNAVIELSNLDKETKGISSALLMKLKGSFKKALLKAQKNGTIDAEKCPIALSGQLLNLWNGINVTQRMNPKDAQVKAIIESSLQILD